MSCKAEVLLISPPFKGLLREPIGLYYLAGVLNKNDISTAIIDFNVKLPTYSGFCRYLKYLNPRIVGITSCTFNFSVVKKIIKGIKMADSRITTVIGGVHASALPEKVLKEISALDFIVLGEGEYTFLEVCMKILQGESVYDIKGIAYRKGDRVVINPPRDLASDLDELPMPNRDLLPFNKYDLASVQTSRGCPHNCIFCNINNFYGRRIRFRDPEKIVDECSLIIEKYNRDRIYFFGDAFTLSSDWTEELCDEIIHRDLNFTWGCETRVDNVTLPILKKMRKACCTEVHYGIDYGDEEVLRNLGKNISIDQIEDAVRWAKEAGLFVGAFFIFNAPGESEETMERTFQLIQRTPIDAIEINLLTPYPGTILWEKPEKFGMKIVDYNFDYYTTKKYVMENIEFPRKQFVPVFKKLLKRLNLIPTSEQTPEIYNFLKRDINLRAWKKEPGVINRILKI